MALLGATSSISGVAMTRDVTPNFKTEPKKKPRKALAKKRATTAAQERRKADKLWGEYIHLRDVCCQVCGKTDGKLEAHHMLVREHAATRCDPDNGVLLCVTHHKFGRPSVHTDPMWAVNFYTERLGIDGYTALRTKAYSGVKANKGFWQGECARLEELLGR